VIDSIVGFITNPVVDRFGFWLFGFLIGFFLRILSDRISQRRMAAAELAAAIDIEILAMIARKRAEGASSLQAIKTIKNAGARYRACVLRKSRFDRLWGQYENQIDAKSLGQNAEQFFESFGYHNYLTAADALKRLLGYVRA
jgi:hypothetical protein